MNPKTILVAITIFAVLSLLFCYPQISGYKLKQNDNIQWTCMAKEAMAYHDSTGKDVLWSNSMYGGMPTFTTYVGAANTNYLGYLQDALQLIGKPAYFFFIYMLCFYVLMLVLGLNGWLGIAGAVAYAFATFNVIIVAAGHETQALSLGYLPAALAGLMVIFRGKWLEGAALFAISIALMSGNNHFQVMFYAAIIFLAFSFGWLYTAIKEGKLKQWFVAALVALGSGALALCPNLPSVMSTRELAPYTIRGGTSELTTHDKNKNGGLDKEMAFAWSCGVEETFVALIPYLFGGGSFESPDHAPRTSEIVGTTQSVPLYWGPQPLLLAPTYFGAINCFLFILGLVVVRSPLKWFILACSVLGFMMAWGSHFKALNYFLFDHVPLVNMFRAVTMARVIPQLLFPVMGMLAIHEIMSATYNKRDLMRKVLITAAGLVAVCIFFAVAGPFIFSYSKAGDSNAQDVLLAALRDDRIEIARNSALRSAGFIVIAVALLWAFIHQKIKLPLFVALLAVIMAIDILGVSKNYLTDSNYVDSAEYNSLFAPREIDKTILKDPDPYYRVLDLSTNPFSNANQAYFHKCIGGNSPALLEKYNDLIQRQMINGFNSAVLDMLNSKYTILLAEKGTPQLITNAKACGNAWFVNEVKWANTDEEVMAAMKATRLGDTTIVNNGFDPRKTAIIRSTFKSTLSESQFVKDTTAFVKLEKYGLDDITFISSNQHEGLAVFSDIYYPAGWKALVDGVETPIINANYVLRAIKVPAGNHHIEFHFHPASFYNYRPVSLTSSILLSALCLAAVLARLNMLRVCKSKMEK